MMSTLSPSAFALNGSNSVTYDAVQQTEEPRKGPPRLKFAVVGTNHPHIYGMVGAALRGGGELAALYESDPELLKAFTKQYPNVKLARSENEVLEDPSIKLVLSSIIPDERAPL